MWFPIALLALTAPVAQAAPEATTAAVARRVATAPKIDGKLDDPAWADAQVIDKFPAFWSKTPSTGSTRARLVWDDQALYFAAEMTDKEMRAFGDKRNDLLWNGDVFELFFKPDPKGTRYYELQANPKSVILELQIPAPAFNFHELAAKPPLGMKAAAIVHGTLDKPGDEDQGWTVEGIIPWSVFEPSGGRPKVGDVWTFALCRYDHGPEGTKPVLTSSAPLTRPSFHRTEDYGKLTFEGALKK